jgi:trehalose 6-phosphate synthase
MPLRQDILSGVLGADLIGLQTRRSADNLCRLALEDADVGLGRGGLDLDGRPIGIGVFPQSIDAAALRALAVRPGTDEQTQAIRAGLGNPQRILLAVDDLHAAAGIEQRLAAYEQILDSGDIDPDHTALIQIVRPDPTDSPTARDLRGRIEHQVGLINGRHGRVGRPALHYQHRTPDEAELVALYRATDVLWATPLQAETSLVTKEYLATRSDNSGAVILSEFCGAADELTDADTANPYDTDTLRRTVLRAIHDTSPTRRNRMAAMRRHVHTHDLHHWAGNLLSVLGQNATAATTLTADLR